MDIKRDPKKKTGRYIAIGVGVLSLVVVTIVLASLRPAAPTVERASLLFGTVKRGPLVIQVHGPGQLKPLNIRYISALTGGRVDLVRVRNGETVRANQVLLEMSNPDVDLQALQADQALSAAQGALVQLRTALESGRLAEVGVVANMRTQANDAERVAMASETLATRNLIAPNDIAKNRDLANQMKSQLAAEEQRLALMTGTEDSQMNLQRDQVARLRAIAESYHERRASMHVTAGVDGVVQDLNLQPGQYVQAGTNLCEVVQPGMLKAVLQIPETQARDITIGQKASTDTRIGLVPGKVIRFDQQSVNGTVTVDVSMDSTLPQGVRPDMQVDGTIEISRLQDALQVGRPAYGQPNSTSGIFRLTDGGRYAERVNVRFGRASVNDIEVVGGLKVGDEVILSDMTRWDNVDRVRVK